MNTYLAPTLTDHGTVVATTLGLFADVSIESPSQSGNGTRAATNGENESTDTENTLSASESKSE